MIISMENVSFTYVTKPILHHVDFVVNEKEKWGIVGVNGSGKSTFLKILAGKEKVDVGTVHILNKYRISYCPQQMEFDENKTVYQTVEEHLGDKKVESFEIKSILNKLKLNNHEQVVGVLSGGQKKRLALAISLIRPADLYLLDEPTNHLDQDMILWLERYLSRMSAALLMVTHDRYFLSRITNHMVEIDQGNVYCYEGNYADYLEKREIRYAQALAMERKRQNFLRTEIEWIRAGAPARSTKQKGRIQRFEAIEAQQAVVQKEKLELRSGVSRLGRKVIEIHDISKSYDRVLFEHFSEMVSRNDRIGIIGNNGCGKSTLLQCMMHQIPTDGGYVDIGETVKIGYFAQTNETMNPNIRLIDYLKDFGEVVETVDHEKITASQMLERFLFPKDMQYSLIGTCSGGEKRRLYLCSILMSAPNVLILDEPTNDLDTDTLTILEDYLEDFKGAVLSVSHDRYFLDKICNRLWVFDNQTIQTVIMDYSSYLTQKTQQETTGKKETSQPFVPTKRISMSYAQKKELEQLDLSLPKLEEAIQQLEQKLSTVSSYQEIQSISEELTSYRDQYEMDSLRWIELSEMMEQSKK